jgi:hypothetical protein
MFCAYVGYYSIMQGISVKMTHGAGEVYLKITAACKLLHLHEEAFRWLFNENYTSLCNKILFMYPDGRKFVTFHIIFLLIEENTHIYYSIGQQWTAIFCVSANKKKPIRTASQMVPLDIRWNFLGVRIASRRFLNTYDCTIETRGHTCPYRDSNPWSQCWYHVVPKVQGLSANMSILLKNVCITSDVISSFTMKNMTIDIFTCTLSMYGSTCVIEELGTL